MKKPLALFAVAALLLAALGAWTTLAAPRRALAQFERAALAGDAAALARVVDFPTLERNLAQQLLPPIHQGIAARSPLPANHPDNLILARRLARSSAGAMASPQGLNSLLTGKSLGSANPAQAGGSRFASGHDRQPSLSHFEADALSADGKAVRFVFERQGLHWRLANIHLPEH